VNTFQRSFVYKSFNRDAAVAADLAGVLQVSTLFEPMLERSGWQPMGMTALEVAVPNLDALNWEQVLEFRAHPGALEARGMLRESERLATEQEPEDARAFLSKVSQEVAGGVFAALEHRRVHVTRTVAEEAAKTAISFIPVVGPLIEKGVTVAELSAAKRSESRSGIAALMKHRGS
jgi:hypothetical protein